MRISVAILQALSKLKPGFEPLLLAVLGRPSWPSEPGASIEWSVAEQIIERVLDVIGEDTPLEAGAKMSARALSLVGLVMMGAPTVRHLIDAGMRFSPLLLSGSSFELIEEGDDAICCFEPPPSSPRVARAVTEFVMSFSVHVAAEVHQQHGHIRSVSFRHAAPPYRQAYDILGCEVRFDAPRNGLSLPRRELDIVMPGADPAMFQLLCQRAEQALVQREEGAPLAMRVKERLRNVNLDGFEITQLAEHLKLSVTSLQRKLKEENTSFSDLLDEVRRDLALDAVMSDHETIKELSERLGFSEASAFHRAFRRWTGLTTREYRDQRRGSR